MKGFVEVRRQKIRKKRGSVHERKKERRKCGNLWMGADWGGGGKSQDEGGGKSHIALSKYSTEILI
jgi:hypothetical protein